MARAAHTDPMRNFKFRVEILPPSGGKLAALMGPDVAKLGFTVVSGLTVQHEMIAYREGGMNTHPHKMIGQSDYGPVTFSKGVLGHEHALWAWHTFLHSWSQGGQSGGSTSGDNDYRADILVKIYDHPVSAGRYSDPSETSTANTPIGGIKMAYKLHNCWPASYSLTDLNAGDSSIMIQQLVINHEGFDIAFAGSAQTYVTPGQIARLG